MKASMHFPHVRIASGRVRVIEADEHRVPFDRVTEIEGWDHSSLDRCEVVHAGADKVHFDVAFGRYHTDGERYAAHESLWVVTKLDDRWGIQARSSFAP